MSGRRCDELEDVENEYRAVGDLARMFGIQRASRQRKSDETDER